MKSILQTLKCIVLFVIMFSVTMAFGKSVDENHAKEIGSRFLSHKTELSISVHQLNLVYQGLNNRSEPCYYIFNVSPKGFVMVAAADCVKPILGYSTSGTFDVLNIPPSMNELLDGYQKEIDYAVENQIPATEAIRQEWNHLLMNDNQNVTKGTQAISPLLMTTWNQDYPYNYFCPEDAAGPGGRVYAGCVATAMAQIIRYWSYPLNGTGEHSYVHTTYGTLSANFGETFYDYAMMPTAISESSPVPQLEAVGTLIYHCGVSVDMDYGANGSGAVSADAAFAFGMYFGYQNPQHVDRAGYDNEAWIALITNELVNSRPVLYHGSGTEGHAFVCDGHDDDFLFHFNWGWSGSFDGYFNLDQLTPGDNNFSQNQGAIIGVEGAFSVDCDAPQTVNAVHNTDENSVNVTWSEVPDQEFPTYLVFRNNVQVKATYETNFSENLTYFPNGQYCYSVKTICDNGNTSDFSSESCINIGPDAIPDYNFEDLEIYPNPANDIIVVKGENIKNVLLYNTVGQLIENISVADTKTDINTSALTSGMYLLRVISNDDQFITKRVVVSH